MTWLGLLRICEVKEPIVHFPYMLRGLVMPCYEGRRCGSGPRQQCARIDLKDMVEILAGFLEDTLAQDMLRPLSAARLDSLESAAGVPKRPIGGNGPI